MRRTVVLGLIASVLSLAIAGCNSSNQRIVVGSKNFTEQVILGELLAQEIEAKTDLEVDRRLNLGGTFVCHQGIVAGELDVYPEYTGTAYTAILKKDPISDPQAVYQQVQQTYAQQFQLEWTEPLGFNNTFAIVIRGDEARKNNLTTLSQATKYTPQWQAGFGYEFLERADGFPGLAKTYNLKFAEQPKVMDLGLLYRALTDKQVDLVAGNSTDGLIDSLGLVVLQDDKQYFPPYEAAPIVRQATLQKHPELRPVFQGLAGKISETEMRRLNYEVDGKRRDVKQVVEEFRKAKNL
uniref:glycine betaine ABC transporter substrate-binding protein n=1 Tax=Trichocoleus desertorum TaxID=1481672 RepID=UPI0025B3B771|nr:glycine betaine ABC transporter substrate-binding protein [Trichocoleus desertorum]